MARKRAKNGRGTVVERANGSWQASCYLLDEYGNKKRKSFYGKSEGEASAKMEEAMKQAEDNGVYQDFSKLTFEEWIKKCMDNKIITPATRESYEYTLKHVYDTIGNKFVKQVRHSDIQKLITNKYTKEKLSTRTVKLIFTLINDFMVKAVTEGIIAKNPAQGVVLPKQEKKETKYLDPDSLKKLMRHAKGSKHYTAILLNLATGIRRGELLALQWKHIDFENNTVTIEQAVNKTKAHGLVIDPPKTTNSKRTITVDDSIMQELRKHKQKQNEYKIKLGELYNRSADLVFCKEDGNLLCPVAFSRTFKRLAEQAGVNGVSFHGLRHTSATTMLENGIDIKTVSATLGHSNIGVTGNIYTHVTDKMRGNASRVIGEALSEYM